MQFEIDHITRYDYTAPVHLGEHLLRFLPLRLAAQQPGRCELTIEPAPTRSEEDLDSWGNRVQRVGFQGYTEHLEIRAHLEVETLGAAAQPAPGDVCLPVAYRTSPYAIAPYLQPLEDPANLDAFVEPLLANAAGDGLAFLTGLNRAVHAFYHRGVRLEGPPRTPAETLARGEGVCRDLTVLFMAACRQVGLAARFVSGYQQGDGTRELRYLHAWPEVYLPDHGWTGYDPTHGVPAGEDHVAVAAAPSAEAVTPVEGGYNFKGETITSTLATQIRITTRQVP
jgi:transglutaminase-like putative cysteine protease